MLLYKYATRKKNKKKKVGLLEVYIQIVLQLACKLHSRKQQTLGHSSLDLPDSHLLISDDLIIFDSTNSKH